jgi:DNA repair exonuclease SbcCD nuclease subunit
VPETTFIHTADLHLKQSSEDALPLLRWLMSKCSERQAALLVSGDFFDSEEEAALMRPEVKEVFSEAPEIPKFILPGDHDTSAFAEGTDYGPEVYLLNTSPFTSGYHEEVEIVGFPFVPNSSLRAHLDEYRFPGSPLVAMVHGTFFGRGTASFSDDVRWRGYEYFPVYGSDLEDIEASYVALGHYHLQHASFIRNDIVVCYPGTPIALTASEIGIRTVVAVTINRESGEVSIERLPVPVGTYNVSEQVEVFACLEEDSLAKVQKLISERADPRTSMTVRLKGNIHLLERDMNERLAAFREAYASQYKRLTLRNETASYRSLIEERPLVRDFMARLAANEELDEETKARALELGLHGFEKAKG